MIVSMKMMRMVVVVIIFVFICYINSYLISIFVEIACLFCLDLSFFLYLYLTNSKILSWARYFSIQEGKTVHRKLHCILPGDESRSYIYILPFL